MSGGFEKRPLAITAWISTFLSFISFVSDRAVHVPRKGPAAQVPWGAAGADRAGTGLSRPFKVVFVLRLSAARVLAVSDRLTAVSTLAKKGSNIFGYRR